MFKISPSPEMCLSDNNVYIFEKMQWKLLDLQVGPSTDDFIECNDRQTTTSDERYTCSTNGGVFAEQGVDVLFEERTLDH